MYYKWERIKDTGIREYGVSGILTMGQTGIYRPIENLKLNTNVFFSSCVEYFEGYLLISPGIIVYSDIAGNSSETKIDLKLKDGVFSRGKVILGTEDGKILIGKKKLEFQEFNRSMKTINRINRCQDKVVLCGDGQISILWQNDDNKIEYVPIGYPYNFVNAYLYRNTVFALSTDGYLNIVYLDDNCKLQSDIYRINIRKALKDVNVYNIYVDAGRTMDIYFLCSDGEVALMPDFKYTKDTISNAKNNLLLYAAKLTNDSIFKDMIKYEDKYIIVGYGEETKSCIQTTMLKNGIIEHNILNSITGPERSVYNSCASYENKYIEAGGDITDLRAIVTREVPVYKDSKGNYISKKDINVNDHYTELIEVYNAVDHNGWQDDKIYVTMQNTATVVLCVDMSRRA